MIIERKRLSVPAYATAGGKDVVKLKRRRQSHPEFAEILKQHMLWLCETKGSLPTKLTDVDRAITHLTGLRLHYANLFRTYLAAAQRIDARLTRTNVTKLCTVLVPVKIDLILAILHMPDEIPFLRQALVEGKVDGSSYNDECACLAGTMSRACKMPWGEFRAKALMPVDIDSPRERWFFWIRKGDTPKNSQVVAITLEWIDEVLAMRKSDEARLG